MSKTVTKPKDPKTVVFAGVFMKLAEMKGEKKLIISPQQEPLNAAEAIVKPEISAQYVKDIEWYQGDLLQTEDGFTPTGTLKALKTKPSQDDLKAVRARVEASYKEIAELKTAWEEYKQHEFKIQSGIAEVPAGLEIDDKVWNLICTSTKLDKYILLLGPKGCGKTETAKRLAEATGMELVSFNMGAAFKPKQMFAGMLQAEDGNTVFIESEFLKAFQSDKPTLIFLDELTRTPQVATNYLMTILDRNQSYIYIEELGKRVYRGSGVRFICAGNVGSQYTDTRTIDGAFWDRFIKLPVDYLSVAKEEKLVMSRAPKANPKAVKTLIERAKKTREAEKSGKLSSAISTRQLIDMAHYLELGFTVEEVFENIFLNNFINGNNDERSEIKAICQS